MLNLFQHPLRGFLGSRNKFGMTNKYMPQNLIQRSANLLLKRQTNILSAAYIIMATVIFSQLLGVVRQRLLASIFSVSNTLGIYDYSTLLPETIFQLIIVAALSSAFIPVFSEYLTKSKEKEGQTLASTLLVIGLFVFAIISIIIGIFAPYFLQLFNLGGQFNSSQMSLMANLLRIFTIAQLLFIIGTFLSAFLQSYNHFFISGFAAALYNLGTIIGVLLFSPFVGIYSAPLGNVLGAFIFILIQLPLAKKVGFSFKPSYQYIFSDGIRKIGSLMIPRTLSLVVFQAGTLILASFISYLGDPGRMYVIYNFAKTLSFAPVALFGASIAQAAFPILSKEKNNPEEFKSTFMASFNQILYIILPVAVLILILRIPLVRFAYGADRVDWDATVSIGRTISFFTIALIAQALTNLVSRAFYALHDTKSPLVIGSITTGIMIIFAYISISIYQGGMQYLSIPYSLFNNAVEGKIIFSFGTDGIALAYSLGSVLNLLTLLVILDKKTGGFHRAKQLKTFIKVFTASFLTAFALYIPIKLLDQLVFDTTRTINLIILTGISSSIGLSLYLFLTWLFDVKEAKTYLLIFKKLGNWREILGISDETIDANRVNL